MILFYLGYLYSYRKFKENFESPIVKDQDEEALKKLKMLISPFILRRLKKDVLTELPEKTISILNNEMEEEQSKIYNSYLIKAKAEVQEELSNRGFESSQIKILSLLTRLRQICCHPSLFLENYTQSSSKFDQCMELVDEAIDSDHKILLFSGYTSMFKIIEEEFNKKNIKYFKLTGETKVEDRVKMVDDFNDNKEVKVFLISLKAGGTGLNLTSADTVIHYDPWWNLSAENQATDRAYRIGQKNAVQVYKLITSGTIEEKIQVMQERKSKLTEDVLSNESKFINKLSKDEIMQLFE
ncbi:MAG: DEAD/DEAH box helicase [Clostridia bacterium]